MNRRYDGIRFGMGLALSTLLGACIAAQAGEVPQNDVRVPAFDKDAFIRSAATDKVLRIGLVDCIAYVLTNNSEVLIKKIEPKLREDDIRIARSAFEPVFGVDATWQDSKQFDMSNSVVSLITETKGVQIDAGVSGLLGLGTRYEVALSGSRTENDPLYPSINPVYQAGPKITITQPLFRGAGREVNSAEIRIAQNSLAFSRQGFRDMVMKKISETLTAYHSYFLTLEQYSINATSLNRTRDLLKVNKERYSKGLISSMDLLETETGVAHREKGLISAEAQQKKAEDGLKLITNLINDPEVWNAKLELIDKPKVEVRQVDLVASLEMAFQHRPDYESLKIDMANRNILVKLAENARYPTVDLVSSFGLNGVGEDTSEAADRLNSDYEEWTVGVQVSVPWGGGDRARIDQRKLEKRQALIGLKRLEQVIILEVRDRVREIDVQYRQTEAARLTLEKERQNYEVQKTRYAAGQLSTHDMMEYEESLAATEAEYIQAVVDYQIAWINLERSEGATLMNHGIVLEE